jgi:hypothetical protein
MAEQFANVFDTKARVVLVFDPDHLRKIDRESIVKVLDVARELIEIPGFRGCLPCAASGFDELPWRSKVLPALAERGM